MKRILLLNNEVLTTVVAKYHVVMRMRIMSCQSSVTELLVTSAEFSDIMEVVKVILLFADIVFQPLFGIRFRGDVVGGNEIRTSTLRAEEIGESVVKLQAGIVSSAYSKSLGDDLAGGHLFGGSNTVHPNTPFALTVSSEYYNI